MALESLIDSAVSQFPTIKKKIGTATLLSVAEKDQHSPIKPHRSAEDPAQERLEDKRRKLLKTSIRVQIIEWE